MRTAIPPRHTGSIVLLVVFLASPVRAAELPKPPDLASVKSRSEYPNIQGLLSGQYWTLLHCSSEQGLKAAHLAITGSPEIERPFQIGDVIEQAGGVDAYRKRVTALLKNRNETVRGFAAVWVGVIGDRRSTADLLELLRAKDLPVDEPVFAGNDRARAATGLGLLGATETAPEIAKLLSSNNPQVRTGAALGLGYLKATQFADEVVKLLNTGEDQVEAAALTALGQMGAKERVAEIAAALRCNDDGVPEAAAYALVRLHAVDRIPDLVALLSDHYKQGTAALAIALLDARGHAKDIAKILDDPKSDRRGDALLALGILGAREFEDQLVKRLDDEKRHVQGCAAWGLILMESRRESARVLAIAADSEAELGATIDGCVQLATPDRQKAFERARAAFKKMKPAK